MRYHILTSMGQPKQSNQAEYMSPALTLAPGLNGLIASTLFICQLSNLHGFSNECLIQVEMDFSSPYYKLWKWERVKGHTPQRNLLKWPILVIGKSIGVSRYSIFSTRESPKLKIAYSERSASFSTASSPLHPARPARKQARTGPWFISQPASSKLSLTASNYWDRVPGQSTGIDSWL